MTAYGENALRATSLAVLVVALLVLVSTVLAALEGRRHELAVLRAAGAGRVAVYAVIVGESFCLTVIGGLLGLTLLFVAQGAMAPCVCRTPLSPGASCRLSVWCCWPVPWPE